MVISDNINMIHAVEYYEKLIIWFIKRSNYKIYVFFLVGMSISMKHPFVINKSLQIMNSKPTRALGFPLAF